MTNDIERIRPIITHYCGSIREQFTSLQTLSAYGNFSTASPDTVAQNLCAELHRMAGAAHCMGYRKFGSGLARLDRKLRKAITKGRSAATLALKESADSLDQLSLALNYITPEHSRVLQIMAESEVSSPPPTAIDERVTRLKIVLADDDKHVQSVMRATLENLGINEIEAVDSGLSLLTHAGDMQPDIIITDWEMQPVSGLELLQCIRNGATPLHKNTPMIFFTNEQDNEIMRSALLNGADRFLKKPVSPAILLKSILHILDTAHAETV